MIRFLHSLLLLTAFVANANEFAVSHIPVDLMAQANAVVRIETLEIQILSRGRKKEKFYSAITILNRDGGSHAEVVIPYDKDTKIQSIRATVYDANGKVLKKIKPTDIKDFSHYDGFSLYSDNRLKYFDLRQGAYPYTVEVYYELDHSGIIALPRWMAIDSEKVGVQKKNLILSFPDNIPPKFKLLNGASNPEEISQNGRIEWRWEISSLPAQVVEPYGTGLDYISPMVVLSPNQFEYGGYAGNLETWESYGHWISKLNIGRNNLPESSRAHIRELTQNASSIEEKARIVYEYLQGKTRYVSIQLGIGGLQPFYASVVDEYGYGDCKALTFYTHALLEEVGVPSHYTLVQAGPRPRRFFEDFPMHQFNHVILAVPNGADTLWMECTSQRIPFGFLGSFTDDRPVLLITENGGKLVRTPRYDAPKNGQHRTLHLQVEASGHATAEVQTHYTGLQYDMHNFEYLLEKGNADQKKWLQENTHIPRFEIMDFSIHQEKSILPSAKISSKYKLINYASVTGKRLFITPNVMNKNTFLPKKSHNRKAEIVVNFEYVDVDSVIVNVPENIFLEGEPEEVSIESVFGSYQTRYYLEGGRIIYTRRLEVRKGVYDPSRYDEFVEFYRDISRADQTRLVFLNKT
jgi:transglutaminase-like putative cysteine protease